MFVLHPTAVRYVNLWCPNSSIWNAVLNVGLLLAGWGKKCLTLGI